MYNKNMREFETIVEFSYNEKQNAYVVRFLDGTLYIINIDNMPHKLKLKNQNIDWSSAIISTDKKCLEITIPGKKKNSVLQIPSHIIHSRGDQI